MSESLIGKYATSKGYSRILYTEKLDDGSSIALSGKNGDYLLATSAGEEFPITLETMDKVRDICFGNLTGLNDYEAKLFERFSNPTLLKTISEESMRKFFEREHGRIPNNFILNILFNPQMHESYNFDLNEKERQERKRKMGELIAKTLKDMGIDLEPGPDTFTQWFTKKASDLSFERKEFLRRVANRGKDYK